MDTEQEKAIGLGADYPFDPLEAGECVIGNTWSSKFKVGDQVTLDLYTDGLIGNMAY